MGPATELPLRPRVNTRPILPRDRGARTTDLDLGLSYDPITRTYSRR